MRLGAAGAEEEAVSDLMASKTAPYRRVKAVSRIRGARELRKDTREDTTAWRNLRTGGDGRRRRDTDGHSSMAVRDREAPV